MSDAEFVAIDVETANADMASVCQIGLAKFSDGQLTAEWSSLIDPEDEFDWMNVSIHGIDSRMVSGAPTFAAIHDLLCQWFDGRIVVSHTSFDRTSIHRASGKYKLAVPQCTWLDSARVARRAWSQFSQKGYGIGSLCKHFGYSFRAHDALEDAKACGFVLSRAIRETGLTLPEWVERVRGPLSAGATSGSGMLRNLTCHPDGPLYGEVIVFTGALMMPRREAASLAANAGADIAAGVTFKTTILVVGDQDIQQLAGHEKSSKHRKAEELMRRGQSIRVIQESDFRELLKVEASTTN